LIQAHTKAAVLSPNGICVLENDPSLAFDSNPCNSISSCVVPELNSNDSHFKVKVNLRGRNRNAFVAAMVDCGATALFIGRAFVKENKIRTHPLSREIPLYNIDGSTNRAGRITRFARLRLVIGDLEEWRQFLVTDLGPEDVVLGLPWLRSIDLDIDWSEGTMKVSSQKGRSEPAQIEHVNANRVQ
jgi:hypothetical protein